MRANNVLLILFLFILSVTGVVYAGVDEYVDIKKYGCQNLHEVQSGEDALRQLYDNLNTDCFLNIPDIELEKIWGIKVTDFDDPNSITKNMSTEEFLKWLDNKPVIKGKMANKIDAEFRWYEDATHRTYLMLGERIIDNGGLLKYSNKFPNRMPPPIIECDDNAKIGVIAHGVYAEEEEYGVYSPKCDYFWKGKKHFLKLNVSYPVTRFRKTGYLGFIFFINHH